MNRCTIANLTALALLCMAVTLGTSDAIAQQKQKVSIKIPVESEQLGVQQNIAVEDAPNHIVRVFEIHYTVPGNAPTINGLKLVGVWQGGIVDIADGTGSTTSYFIFAMENGDKFFVRNASIIQPAAAGRLAAAGAGHITGGTGKLGTIQGIIQQTATFDPKAGVLGESQIDIEYSMGK